MRYRSVDFSLKLIAAVGIGFFLASCGNPPSKNSLKKSEVPSYPDNSQLQNSREVSASVSEKTFEPFYVFTEKGSRLNHFVPSGFMPNGKCLAFDDMWGENCHDGKTCIKIAYDLQCSRADQNWAGIYWLNPANNWGHRKGGYNLTGAQKLSFWARGEKGGEQIQEFTIGGINGTYPDSDVIVIGPIILTNQWRQYSMDLRGKDLSYISGGFSWSSNTEVNDDSCTFYLDKIRFE